MIGRSASCWILLVSLACLFTPLGCSREEETQAPSVLETIELPAGRFRQEIGPAGNEYIDPSYTRRAPESEVTFSDLPPVVQNVTSAIIPDGAEYDIQVEEEEGEEYTFYTIDGEIHENKHRIEIREDGRPGQIEYQPKTGIEERPGQLVLPGGLEVIPVSGLPARVVEAVAVFPDLPVTKAWLAETVAGKRYLVQLERPEYARVVSLTAAGQIRAADTPDKMLKEVAPEREAIFGPSAGETEESIAGLLAPHSARYDVGNTIERIRRIPVDAEDGFRFVVLGAPRSNDEVWDMIAESINTYEPAFAIATGDLVENGTAQEFADHLIPTLETKATGYRFLPVMGDDDSGYDGRQYDSLFGEDARVYHFHYGDSVFVVLDNASKGDRMPWAEQLALAGKWLTESPNEHKFVFVHKPPAGVLKWSHRAASPDESREFTDLMTKHNVDDVFLGHVYAYSTAEIDGIAYTTTGGGGAPLDTRFGWKGSTYHFVIVDVGPEGVRQQVVRFYENT
jgi:hypothetical protein